MTRIYAVRSGGQIVAGARELNILQTSKPVPMPTQPPTPAFSLAVKLPGHSMPTHISLEPSLTISGVIPPLNLSPSMAHSGTTLL